MRLFPLLSLSVTTSNISGECAVLQAMAATSTPADSILVSMLKMPSAGFTALVLYAPALHGVFATVSLSAGQLGVVVALALSPAVLVELGKAMVRRSAYDSARERGAAR